VKNLHLTVARVNGCHDTKSPTLAANNSNLWINLR
jgi:hypothetical protein